MTSIELEKLENLQENNLGLLCNIAHVYTTYCEYKTSSALRSGAILLGVSTIDNDDAGDGFRFCIGFPKELNVNKILTSINREGL
jgi:hypothetical protein